MHRRHSGWVEPRVFELGGDCHDTGNTSDQRTTDYCPHTFLVVLVVRIEPQYHGGCIVSLRVSRRQKIVGSGEPTGLPDCVSTVRTAEVAHFITDVDFGEFAAAGKVCQLVISPSTRKVAYFKQPSTSPFATASLSSFYQHSEQPFERIIRTIGGHRSRNR